jgi:hypothetical protein
MASLDAPRQRLSRVKIHYEELSRELETYYSSFPATVWLDKKSTLEQPIWVSKDVPVPSQIGLILGDCLQAMRSSLDYLVWELVLAAGNEPCKQNAFPVTLTREDFLNEVKKRHRLVGVDTKAIELIDLLQPYHDTAPEKSALAILDILTNTHKHRRVLLTGWRCLQEPNGVDFYSFKILTVEDTGERLLAYVGLNDGVIQGIEICAFVDALAMFLGDIVIPQFELFFK